MKNVLGEFDIEWECCKNCEHYFEKGMRNGCLAVGEEEDQAWPDEDHMDIYLDNNYVVVLCRLFKEKK